MSFLLLSTYKHTETTLFVLWLLSLNMFIVLWLCVFTEDFMLKECHNKAEQCHWTYVFNNVLSRTVTRFLRTASRLIIIPHRVQIRYRYQLPLHIILPLKHSWHNFAWRVLKIVLFSHFYKNLSKTCSHCLSINTNNSLKPNPKI